MPEEISVNKCVGTHHKLMATKILSCCHCSNMYKKNAPDPKLKKLKMHEMSDELLTGFPFFVTLTQ